MLFVANVVEHVNQLMFNGSMPYDMYQYDATPANFYPTQGTNKISVEFTSSLGDDKDRRRKRSDASKSGEKETVTNMHMVRGPNFFFKSPTYLVAAKESTESSLATSFSRTQGEACQRSGTSTRGTPRKTSRSAPVI